MRMHSVMLLVCVLSSAAGTHASAQVTAIEILSREPAESSEPTGAPGRYEILRGRIHGEVDPSEPLNGIIQDLQLARRNARGRVEYVATFALAKPIDLTRSSHVLMYQVVNRGNGGVSPDPDGHIVLVSGWQGDVTPTDSNYTIAVPVATQPDGSPITGPMVARFFDVPAGTHTREIHLSSMGTGPPQYLPATLDQTNATLTMYASESPDGAHTGTVVVPRDAWAFADCSTTPFPGSPDPSRVCLKDGFDATKLYELTYSAKDPLVLGIGLAATRDIVSFFHHAEKDAAGTPNPVAGAVRHVVAIGDSQSGNFIRTFIHLGFNEDLSHRIVWNGAFPRIAARQTPINLRFALPGGAAGLYEPGSDGVVWWGRYEDHARGLPAASLLDRCTATRTCPKIVEAFGSAEFWGLRLSPDLIGTDARHDIPLPSNVRRYYYPGTTHGGGHGGFHVDAEPGSQRGCSLPANPNPEIDTTRALTHALVDWVTKGTPPPASRYPRLAAGELVPVSRATAAFPHLPGLAGGDVPLNPLLEYDFGPDLRLNDLTGTIARMPPRILRTLPSFVPIVNADGNETTGVPSVLHQAPLGTYLGWNRTAAGFFAGRGCGFAGGYIPFARTRAQRTAANDPRPSIEERYGTIEGYVCAVERAARQAVADRFLLLPDADRLVAEARKSGVLPDGAASTDDDRSIARSRCSR